MAEFTLAAQSVMQGAVIEAEGASIREVETFSLFSLAWSDQQQGEFEHWLHTTFSVDLPSVGKVCLSADTDTRVMRVQRDQCWLLQDADTPVIHSEQLPAGVYLTDQSDSWLLLRLLGTDVRRLLERGCMLDLDTGLFPPQSLARTSLEGMGVVIVAEEVGQYLLLSARSSASSIWHFFQQSIDYLD